MVTPPGLEIEASVGVVAPITATSSPFTSMMVDEVMLFACGA